MMEILYQQNPSIFLFGLPSLYGVGDNVTGVRRLRGQAAAADPGRREVNILH